MKVYLVFGFFILLSFLRVGKCNAVKTWEFGHDAQVLINTEGKIGWLAKETDVPLNVSDCYKVTYVKVSVKNYLATPAVTYNSPKKLVTIKFRPLDISASTYAILAKGYARPDCVPDLPLSRHNTKVSMHPLRERACDALLDDPTLQSPPPIPERPRPPRVRRPRQFKLPPKFELLTPIFYDNWCNHQKQLQMSRPKVDDSPPELFPELYLKPRRLNFYARQLEANMVVNKDLLKRINLIQRTGGFVDCWMRPEPTNKYNKLLCKQRQRALNEIRQQNLYFYSRLLTARSEQPLTREFDELWKDTKHKLILGASLPFILFKTDKIDRDIRDPAFDKPPNVHRTKVVMEIWVLGGSKIGRVTIELFTDLCPQTCQLFLTLLRGDRGYAYLGTRFFRIVPDLYCRGGDVEKDNGFGCYLPEGSTDPMGPENFILKHTVPGVLSMVVSSDNEVSGQFNIIFKPLPQLDGKHVVFGRVVGGPAQALERISALGLPLGTTTADCMVRYCGWYTRAGQYREGAPNTIKFPPRRKV